jgi:hypothetical protein
MTRILFVVLAGLLTATGAGAQPIHGHPQKSAYASPAEWPHVSTQGHWKATNVLGHTHIQGRLPLYAEHATGRLEIPLEFVLFHTNGRLAQVSSPLGWVRWNVGPSYNPYPNIAGNPTGVVVVTGTLIIDPANATGTQAGPTWWNPHGWTSVSVTARTEFSDGSFTKTTLAFPMFSTRNPSASIVVPGENTSLMLRSELVPHAPRDAMGNGWGAMITEFKDYIPIAPMAAGEVWNPPVHMYSYAALPDLQNGTKDRRLNPDLHNGVVGTQITSPFSFDANFSGIGLHKFSFIWDKTIGDVAPAGIQPNQEGSALLVVTVGVGDGPAPPPPPPPVDPCLTKVQVVATIPAGVTVVWPLDSRGCALVVQ